MDSKKTWILDGVFLLLIVLVGWFLIGYYLNYNYLATGYQDWIYHAFRIKSIQEWGIVSWDHKWANGINYWRSYQYIPHLLTLYTAKFLNIGITNAMILWGIIVYLYLRITGYLLLRYMNVSPHVALGAIMLSYAYRQNWIGISDFSIFIACILIPLVIFLSIKSTEKKINLLLFASISGLSWIFHPIVGLFSSGLFMLTNAITTKFRNLTSYISVVVLVVAAAPYWTQYALVSYRFSNPYVSTTTFLKEVALGDYFGIGLLLLLTYIGAFFVTFLSDSKYIKWLKIVGIYIGIYLVLFVSAKYDYTPQLLNRFQFARVNLIVGLVIPIFAGVAYDFIFNDAKSRFVIGVYSIIIALIISHAIGIATQHASPAVNSIDNPIPKYFSQNNPTGEIYYHSESEASYFTDWNIRLSGSYNEHLLPSPLSLRFKQIMSGGKSHLIVSQRQIDLINEYSKVLGVEYLVLPIKSPITKSLLSSETLFVYQDDVKADNSAYSVFRNEENTTYAYVMERSVFDANVDMNDLEKPDLRSSSYDVWDTEVESLSELFSSDLVQALPMDFVNTDELHIHTDEMNQFDDPVILVTQSYDTNWSVIDDASATIEPTSLRFMKIEPSSFNNTITLKNSWPSWHWPVQFLGFGSVIVSAIAVGVYEMTRKEKHAI